MTWGTKFFHGAWLEQSRYCINVMCLTRLSFSWPFDRVGFLVCACCFQIANFFIFKSKELTPCHSFSPLVFMPFLHLSETSYVCFVYNIQDFQLFYGRNRKFYIYSIFLKAEAPSFKLVLSSPITQIPGKMRVVYGRDFSLCNAYKLNH